MFLNETRIDTYRIGPGDDVFFPGLFSRHIGEKTNSPILRTGAIAAMAEEYVHTKWCGFMRAYLVEARSIGGLSGSPVFTRTQMKRFGDDRSHFDAQFYLLGLVHGHYGTSDVSDSTDDQTPDGQETKSINMGIAIVVPADGILELLNQKHFVDLRNDLLRAERESSRKDFPKLD